MGTPGACDLPTGDLLSVIRSRGGDVQLRWGESFVHPSERHLLGASAAAGVSSKAMLGLPAAYRAIRVASEAVAKLRCRVYRGDGFERKPVTTTWQARLLRGVPNSSGESWFKVWEKTEASLTGRNNAYWLKIHNEKRQVIAVEVVCPDYINARISTDTGRPEYQLMLPWGRMSGWLGPEHILHFYIGELDYLSARAPTPVELFRDTLGAGIAQNRYLQDFYNKGVMQSLAVSFPREVGAEVAKRWREAFEGANAGLANAHGVRVFGLGAEVKTIGLSLQDAQYVESQRFTVEECARIFGVQASLIGGGQAAGDKPITPEHEEDRWLRHGLSPRLGRIEEDIYADPSFFGGGSVDYPMFDTEGVLRGDLKTEAEVEHMRIQDGTLLVDEARARRGQDPLPDGAGMVPQVTPVGGAPNPNPFTPSPSDDEDEDEAT